MVLNMSINACNAYLKSYLHHNFYIIILFIYILAPYSMISSFIFDSFGILENVILLSPKFSLEKVDVEMNVSYSYFLIAYFS